MHACKFMCVISSMCICTVESQYNEVAYSECLRIVKYFASPNICMDILITIKYYTVQVTNL